MDVCMLEVTTHSLNFKILNYVIRYNRNVNSGLEGYGLENKCGVDFFIEPPLKSSPNVNKITFVQKKGNISTQINSQILILCFCYFLGSFAIWGSGATIAHPPHALHPPTHVQLKFSTTNIYDMLHLSAMRFFRSTGNHFHIRINIKKTYLGYVALK